MKTKTMAAIYSILVGVSIIGMWTMLYINGSIPEFDLMDLMGSGLEI